MSTLPWQGRTAFVTGGSGFIGSALAQRLAELGAHVVIPTRDRSLVGKRHHPHIDYVPSRLGDAGGLAEQLTGVSAVFNLAYDFRRSAKENIALYEAMADACTAAGVPMLVQASSIAVYDGWPTENIDESSPCDGPGHDYKIGKRAIEKDIASRVAAGAFDAVILQPTIVYGPGSPQWVDALVERMAGGTLILPQNLEGLCNGVYIDDVVGAFIAAADMERGGGERYIVSGPQPFLWSALFSAYAEACGAELRFEAGAPYIPSAPAKPGKVKALVSSVLRGASATAAGMIGTTRLARLRGTVMRLKPGNRVYRPAAESRQLLHATGLASIENARNGLYVPQVGAEEGLGRTQAYIREKFA